MSDTSEQGLFASNGHATLSLDDLAVLHGGLATFMVEVSNRALRAFQAGRARNRRVATHQLGELVKVLRRSVMVRPQYREAMERFIETDLAAVRTVVQEERWDQFDMAWDRLTSSVNEYHEEFNHGYLRWRVPEDAPSDLDLAPRE